MVTRSSVSENPARDGVRSRHRCDWELRLRTDGLQLQGALVELIISSSGKTRSQRRGLTDGKLFQQDLESARRLARRAVATVAGTFDDQHELAFRAVRIFRYPLNRIFQHRRV